MTNKNRICPGVYIISNSLDYKHKNKYPWVVNMHFSNTRICNTIKINHVLENKINSTINWTFGIFSHATHVTTRFNKDKVN